MPSQSPTDYPRDLAGYGRNTPDPRWPGGARVALQFVVNFEEGGENSILHGDPASEAFLSDVLGAQPWRGQRHMNVESMFEYGSRAGFWRLWRIFTARNLAVTVFGVAGALAPQSASGHRHARGRLGDRLSRPQMDRLQGFLPRRRSRAYARGDPAAHRGDRRTAVRLVYRTDVGAHARSRSGRGRLSLFVGFLCRRLAVLGARTQQDTAPDHSVYARCQRYALYQCARLRERRRVLWLSARQLRCAVSRRRNARRK